MTIINLFSAGPAWAMHHPVGRQTFATAYLAATGTKVCASCPSQLYRAYFNLKTILTNHFMQTNQRYKLKPGIMLLDANQTPYTALNITDEVAANLIAQNPALAAYFEIEPTPSPSPREVDETASQSGEGEETPPNPVRTDVVHPGGLPQGEEFEAPANKFEGEDEELPS